VWQVEVGVWLVLPLLLWLTTGVPGSLAQLPLMPMLRTVLLLKDPGRRRRLMLLWDSAPRQSPAGQVTLAAVPPSVLERGDWRWLSLHLLSVPAELSV
jgi:hypothetical protein